MLKNCYQTLCTYRLFHLQYNNQMLRAMLYLWFASLCTRKKAACDSEKNILFGPLISLLFIQSPKPAQILVCQPTLVVYRVFPKMHKVQ